MAKAEAKKNDINILDMIEEEESKRGKEKKDLKQTSAPPAKKAKAENKELPPHVTDKRIPVKAILDGRKFDVSIKEVKGTCRSVYVHDIHSFNPQVLETIYWLNLEDHPYVIVRVSKADYQYVVDHKKKAQHNVTVIDCAVDPTLSYGWDYSHIKGELPTPEQVAEQDKEFKNNPTHVHNYPVKVSVKEAIEAEVAATAVSDDDEFDILDDEEEFDFTE